MAPSDSMAGLAPLMMLGFLALVGGRGEFSRLERQVVMSPTFLAPVFLRSDCRRQSGCFGEIVRIDRIVLASDVQVSRPGAYGGAARQATSRWRSPGLERDELRLMCSVTSGLYYVEIFAAGDLALKSLR